MKYFFVTLWVAKNIEIFVNYPLTNMIGLATICCSASEPEYLNLRSKIDIKQHVTVFFCLFLRCIKNINRSDKNYMIFRRSLPVIPAFNREGKEQLWREAKRHV